MTGVQTCALPICFPVTIAAVSDYIPKEKFEGKLKKEKLGETWSLELTKNIDILATLNKSEIYAIGFKAEMDKKEAKSNAQNMLKNKNMIENPITIQSVNNLKNFK